MNVSCCHLCVICEKNKEISLIIAHVDHVRLSLKYIKGSSGSWELHHVTLNITKKSRVVFEGVKGDASATLGGLSLDDVNIWSGQCPQHVWKIRNITSLLATTPVGTKVYSPSFLSPTGYSFQVSPNQHLALEFHSPVNESHNNINIQALNASIVVYIHTIL